MLIRDEADRIRGLVDRMEIFGEKPIARGAVNTPRVLEHVRRLALCRIRRAFALQGTYDPSLPPVWGDRDLLVQVVLNLVKNAATVTEAGSRQRGNHADHRLSTRRACVGARGRRPSRSCR